ncbi:MAG: glycosyltransferase family 4 protein [Candidatus Omnitrophota bacterium]|nr:glycosyltransferase family 4 protein [Candidatus Omnitrophota bacterium]
MRILFVRTYCPHSINYGSEMRASRFVDYLRRKGEVDLLTMTSPSGHADINYIERHFRRHYHFNQKGNPRRLTRLEKLRHLLPWQITGHYAKDFQQELNAIVEENQYDLIFVFKLEPVFYFLQLPAKWRQRTVVDYDDFLSDIYKNHYRNIFTAYKNSYSLMLYQHKALVRFKRIFVCAREALLKVPGSWRHKAGVIPNVFNVDPKGFYAEPGPKNRLLFIGSLDYFPNIDGLKWFCRDIWPGFHEKHPNSILTVVGKTRNDAEHVRSLFNHPENLEVAVNVPSTLPYYQNCFASVVPLLNGSGTRLKILESAAYGRPVLATSKGMEGLNFEDGKNIFIFKNSRSFLNAYESLLDEERYRNVTRSAFTVLEDQYSPEAFTECMDENWNMMVDSQQRLKE